MNAKQLIAFTIFMVLAIGVRSQEIPKDIQERIDEISYVFEGKVISSVPYEISNGDFIYTSNTIQISRVFKGDLQCGTIELLTRGGDLGTKKIDISHNLELAKGVTGIFLANLTNKELSAVDYFPETNIEKLEGSFDNQSLIKYWDDILTNETKAFDLTHGNYSIEDVYQLIEFYTGQPVIPCVDNLIEPNIGFIKNKILNRNQSIEKSTLSLNDMLQEEAREQSNIITKPSTITNDLTVSHLFTQEQLVTIVQGTDTSDWVELTIDMADDSAFVYLGYTQFYITYDTATFGPNIWDNTYSKFELERGNVFMNNMAYKQPSAYNLNDSTLVVNIFLEDSPIGRYDLSYLPEQALISRFKLRDCTPTPDFNFEVNDNISYYTSPNSDTNIKYDFFNKNDWEMNSCLAGIPKIDSFISSYDGYHKIRAGVFDTLRVYGKNFGDSFTGNANVYFPNASDGGATRFGLSSHSFDVIPTSNGSLVTPWTDSLITILMPSYTRLYYTSQGTLANSAPGSGIFYLVNEDSLYTSSPGGLTIQYSIFDDYSSRSTSMLCFSDSSVSGEKIKIRLDSEVASYANGKMKAVIEFALKEWTCKTGIDWELDADTLNLGAAEDDIFHICFVESNASFAAQTPNYYYDNCEENHHYYYDEFDIEINKTKASSFIYDTSRTVDIGLFDIDFLAVIEHELGHGLRMNHLVDSDDLMYYSTLSNIPASQRQQIQGKSLEGGLFSCHKSFNAQNFVTSSCAINPFPGIQLYSIDSIKCSGTTSIFPATGKDWSINIFPNPTYEHIYVHSEDINLYGIDFEVYNQVGQLIFHGKTIDQKISLGGLPKGIYLLNLKDKENVFTFKVVKL